MPAGIESCRNPAVLLKTSTVKSGAACAGTAVKPTAAGTMATQRAHSAQHDRWSRFLAGAGLSPS